MNKLTLLTLIAALSCAGQTHDKIQSTGPAPVRTAGFCNGRFWMIMESQEKINWLEAYRNGATFAVMSFADLAKMKNIVPDGLTWGEIRAAIDRFYEAPENAPIPLSDALQLLAMKTSGVEQSVIDKQTSDIRRLSIKTGTQDAVKPDKQN